MFTLLFSFLDRYKSHAKNQINACIGVQIHKDTCNDKNDVSKLRGIVKKYVFYLFWKLSFAIANAKAVAVNNGNTMSTIPTITKSSCR